MRLFRFIFIILLVAVTSAFAKDSPEELLDGLPDVIGAFCAERAVRSDKNIHRNYRFKDIHINVELYEMGTPIKDGYDSRKDQRKNKVLMIMQYLVTKYMGMYRS